MNTVYCYDRFATAKRATLGGLLLLSAAALLGFSLPAGAAPVVHKLPTVVVTGKSMATLAAEAQARQSRQMVQAGAQAGVQVVQLPRVLVVGYRQATVQQVALRTPGQAAF